MLKLLKLIVNSFFITSLFYSSLLAKKIPITEEVSITIPLGSFSVVEFPFKIEGKNITSFMVNKIKGIKNNIQKEKVQQVSTLDNLQNTLPKEKKKIPAKKKSNKYISIVQNTNGFTFFTKKEGVMKMVIWGYDYPILLTLRVSKKNGYGLYQFTVPQSKSKEVDKTELGSHESIINKLMVHLFNQTLPKGYKSDSEDFSFTSNKFQMRLNREIIGKRYLGQEWLLTNNSSKKTQIHEESFYQKGIFGISLEDNIIDTNESIRVFIVRAKNKKRDKKYAK